MRPVTDSPPARAWLVMGWRPGWKQGLASSLPRLAGTATPRSRVARRSSIRKVCDCISITFAFVLAPDDRQVASRQGLPGSDECGSYPVAFVRRAIRPSPLCASAPSLVISAVCGFGWFRRRTYRMTSPSAPDTQLSLAIDPARPYARLTLGSHVHSGYDLRSGRMQSISRHRAALAFIYAGEAVSGRPGSEPREAQRRIERRPAHEQDYRETLRRLGFKPATRRSDALRGERRRDVRTARRQRLAALHAGRPAAPAPARLVHRHPRRLRLRPDAHRRLVRRGRGSRRPPVVRAGTGHPGRRPAGQPAAGADRTDPPARPCSIRAPSPGTPTKSNWCCAWNSTRRCAWRCPSAA